MEIVDKSYGNLVFCFELLFFLISITNKLENKLIKFLLFVNSLVDLLKEILTQLFLIS